MNQKTFIALLAAVVVIVGLMSVYTVDETEQVVVTLFGKVKRVVEKPGLHAKIPLFEKAITYPKNLQEWDGDPGQIPTKDKTYITVDTFARWKIVDPVLFLKTIGTDRRMAINRLNEIIDPAARNLITSNRLIEAVRNTNRELDILEAGLEDLIKEKPVSYSVAMGRNQIEALILQQAEAKLNQFGITLVDVKIKRIDYVEEVRKSVYGRMIAERKQIAEKFRSEGQGEAQKILGDKELDLKRIESEAYRRAQELKGSADAESTRLYAEAFAVDPEFYSFIKTLEIYSEVLDKNSSLILSTESDLFRLLKRYSVTK
ncbi:MAG: protease modulator HflC [Desulfobacteraceae bacterium]|nr:MAG: protease modulator HflC [Desulfobacteraceae bacterium]